MGIITKKVVVRAGHGFPRIEKEVTFLIGRGEHCTCGDCPVLYGETCPTTKEWNRKHRKH